MKRAEILIICLSLLLGLGGTGLYARYARLPEPLRLEQTAWWGGLYPEYSLPGALEGEQQEESPEGQVCHVRIRFKYLTFLNELGGTEHKYE